MDKYIVERVLKEANYILENESTVRDIANIYCVSKSTVHKDLQDRLRDIDIALHKEVDRIFKHHIEVRHIRGGQSTKEKYLKL